MCRVALVGGRTAVEQLEHCQMHRMHERSLFPLGKLNLLPFQLSGRHINNISRASVRLKWLRGVWPWSVRVCTASNLPTNRSTYSNTATSSIAELCKASKNRRAKHTRIFQEQTSSHSRRRSTLRSTTACPFVAMLNTSPVDLEGHAPPLR